MSNISLARKGHGSRTLLTFFSHRVAMKWLSTGTMVVALAACGRSQQQQDSAVQYAHWQPELTYGGPAGRLLAMKLGFKTDFDKVTVCVETGHPTMPEADALFEVKLAYAGWLKASGGFTELDWQKLSFVSQRSCTMNQDWGAVVIYGKPQQASMPPMANGRFREARISCYKKGVVGCRMESLTLGVGGPGILARSSRGQQWTALSGLRPSMTYLSQYVDWVPLEKDLTNKPSAAMPTPVRDSLLSSLRSLRSTPQASLESLSRFVAALKQAQAIANKEPTFTRISQEFFRTGGDSLEQSYRPQYTVFHTLVHELGHQMGMDHADAPDADSRTGQAEGATRNGGQWVNSHSAMAYADHYLFLTDDDEQGAASNARAIEAMLKAHR